MNKSEIEPYWTKIQRLNEELLTNIKKNLPELEELLEKVSGDCIVQTICIGNFTTLLKLIMPRTQPYKLSQL